MPNIVITRILPACHRGDLAIAQGMLEAITRRFPDWRLTIFCRDPAADRDLFRAYGDVEPEIFAPRSDAAKTSERVRLLRYLAWYFLGWPRLDAPAERFFDACRNSSAVLFCGGGSPGGYGQPNLLRHALIPVLLAQRAYCPVMFSGLGLEPLSSSWHRNLTRLTLNRAKLLSVRDSTSAQIAYDFGVRTPIELGIDWAVDLRPAPPDRVAEILTKAGIPEPRGLRVVMNLRDENASGPEGQQRSARYRQLMVSTIHKLLENPDVRIVVVSMTHSKRTRDDSFAESVRADLAKPLQDRFHVLSAALMPGEIKGVIQTGEAFFGTRLHPLLFALTSGIPAVAVHDSAKVRSFLQQFSMERWLIDHETADATAVHNTFQELIGQRAAVAAQLRHQRPRLETGLKQNLDAIEKMVRTAGEPSTGADTLRS